MSTLQNLNEIKALALNIMSEADSAIEALDDAPAVVIPQSQKWAIPQRILVNDSGYNEGPQLIECNNGDIVCLYRNGAGHLSVGGKLHIKRSTDRARTFGSPSLVFETAGKDCRNQSLGKNPASGRLIGFSRTADNANVTYARWKHISDDHGVTWTTTEFTNAPAGHVPFGTIVVTSNGLCQLFYAGNSVVALFSTDDGESWGNQKTVYYAVQSSAQFAEPTIVAIDEDRLVVVMRDNFDGGRYWYVKSSDGGLTYSGATQGRWTATTGLQAAPPNLAIHGDTVFMAFDTRAPNWKQFVVKVDKEVFWTNPLTGWTGGVVVGSINTYNSKVAGGNATGAEYGYVSQLSLAEGVLRAWYDSKTGNGNTETCIHISSN